jgi:hypothetical protein
VSLKHYSLTLKRGWIHQIDSEASQERFAVNRFIGISLGSVLLIGVAYFLPAGSWAAIGELPAHPLVVHGVVVLVPLLALTLLVGAWKLRFLERYHLVVLALSGLSTVGVIVAQSSGNSLSAAVGLPEKHAEWGNRLVPLAIALTAITILFVLFTFYRRVALVSNLLRGLLVIISITAIVMTYIVGHSGAESVWKDRYAAAKVPIAFSLDKFTIEEVATHDRPTDCWTIIDGFVYDVTSFIRRHPSGSESIEKMCGIDASEQYAEAHKGQREPAQWLETLKIGRLK